MTFSVNKKGSDSVILSFSNQAQAITLAMDILAQINDTEKDQTPIEVTVNGNKEQVTNKTEQHSSDRELAATINHHALFGWVQAKIIERYKGISTGALNKMRERGKITEGIHFQKRNGKYWYQFENIDQLIEQGMGLPKSIQRQYFQFGWVLPKIVEQYKGISVGGLSKLKERGKLAEGIHYQKRNGRIWYHFENLNTLIDSGFSDE